MLRVLDSAARSAPVARASTALATRSHLVCGFPVNHTLYRRLRLQWEGEIGQLVQTIRVCGHRDSSCFYLFFFFVAIRVSERQTSDSRERKAGRAGLVDQVDRLSNILL